MPSNGETHPLFVYDRKEVFFMTKRILMNNFDSYMYYVHERTLGFIHYREKRYNFDSTEDCDTLLTLLVDEQIVIPLDEPTGRFYGFIDSNVIYRLKEKFQWKDGHNKHMSPRAILLNLHAIRYFDNQFAS
jgi:hypothetical protein